MENELISRHKRARENFPLGSNSSKLLLWLAYFLLILGGIIGIYLWADFNYGYINIMYKMKIADFGAILGGTVGSIWALASVVFFVYNLLQQREIISLQKVQLEMQGVELKNQVSEMKHANETAIMQQKAITEQTLNSMFYTLLENNKRVVRDIKLEELDKLKEEIIAYTTLYKNHLEVKLFSSFVETQRCPTYHIFDRHRDKMNDFENFKENVVDIIGFIESNIEKKEFYHKMFFNQLSYPEKFLIGFILNYNLFNTENVKSSFDYSKNFKSSTAFYNPKEENYFPAINAGFYNSKEANIGGLAIIYKGKNDDNKLLIVILENLLKEELTLKRIQIDISPPLQSNSNTISKYCNYEIKIVNNAEILLKEILGDIIISANNIYKACLTFTFNYLFLDYEVKYYIDIRFPSQDQKVIGAIFGD